MIEVRDAVAVPAGFDGTVAAGFGTAALVDASGSAERTVGVLVWRSDLGVATVAPLWTVDGLEADAEWLDAVLRFLRAAGAVSVTVEVEQRQHTLSALLHGAPVLSTYMTAAVSNPPPALPDGFGHRPMTADEYAAWRQAGVEEYATSNLERCGGNRELALQRSHESFAQFLPDGPDTVDTRVLALTQDGERVGDLWLRHHWPSFHGERSPDETFVFDVAVLPERRGEGLGRAAMVLADRLAGEVRDREVGLNVFGDNTVAIGLYRRQGFVSRSTVYDVTDR